VFELIGLIATAAVAAIGYFQSRAFVRRRLAYVDAVHNAAAPIVAGAGAWLLAMPIVALVPLVGGFTAILFGVGVGVGVAAGVKDIRRRLPSG
jgi:hypothetical protein